MTRIVSTQTRLDQAVELVSQLSLDEIKQLLQRVPTLNRRFVENVDRHQSTYAYLEERPHRWRKQLYLKGRNMTVGQLIYKMRTNRLSVEDAAEDMDLPVEQIMEAQRYYQTHRGLIEREADEEKQRLMNKGYSPEPQHLPR